MTWGVSLKLNPCVRPAGLSPAGTVGRLGFWRLMRDTKSGSLEPRSEQKVSKSSEARGEGGADQQGQLGWRPGSKQRVSGSGLDKR